MELILVGIGGAIGSISRFQLGKMLSKRDRTFPLATFIVNILGGIGLGIFIGLNHNMSLGLFIADGFFGAFTTFSTFMYEGAYLLGQNKKVSAMIYIASSLVLGILGYYLGNTLVLSIF
jgi:CrcB protein